MLFTSHGGTCVRIAAKAASILMEARGTEGAAEILTFSDDAVAQTLVDTFSEARIISWPGEYEVQGVFVIGIAASTPTPELPHPPTVYVVETEGVSVCHLGALRAKLSPEQVEQLGDVDVLLLPVQEEGGIDPTLAKSLIEQVEPRIVVFLPEGDVLPKIATVIGVEPERTAELKVDARSLPEEHTNYVALTA